MDDNNRVRLTPKPSLFRKKGEGFLLYFGFGFEREKESALAFMDDLLDFSLDVGEEEEREENEGGIGKLFLLTFFRNVINLMILAAVFCLRRIMQKKNWNGFQKKMHSQPLKHSLTSSPSKQPRNVSKQHIPVSVLDNTSTSSNSNHSDTTNKTNTHVNIRLALFTDEWWNMYGSSAPTVRNMAIRILPQTSSSSACERNWSTFSLIHMKLRNRLAYEKLHKLVFCYYNMKLKLRDMEAETDKVAENDYLDLLDIEADAENVDGYADPMFDWVRPAHLDEEEGNPDPRIAKRKHRLALVGGISFSDSSLQATGSYIN